MTHFPIIQISPKPTILLLSTIPIISKPLSSIIIVKKMNRGPEPNPNLTSELDQEAINLDIYPKYMYCIFDLDYIVIGNRLVDSDE